jgi:hypothetical protein
MLQHQTATATHGGVNFLSLGNASVVKEKQCSCELSTAFLFDSIYHSVKGRGKVVPVTGEYFIHQRP